LHKCCEEELIVGGNTTYCIRKKGHDGNGTRICRSC